VTEGPRALKGHDRGVWQLEHFAQLEVLLCSVPQPVQQDE